MRLITLRFFLAGILLASALLPVGHAQQPTAAPDAVQAGADPIVGWWKLNLEKSTNATSESGLIAITAQGSQFQIVFQAMQSNKYNPHYQVTTDMKGGTAKPVQADGKPMNDEWRVTRNQPHAFVVESVGPFGGWKKEYTVSSDGRTLTVRDLPGSAKISIGAVDSKGVVHPIQQMLVFERISDSQGRALSQIMADTDAAQKAEAAKQSAAQAALDASACGLGPGQSEAPSLISDQTTWHQYVCPKDGFGITLPNAPRKQSLQQTNSYKLFMTEDESIVVQLWVSAEPVDCAVWLRERRTIHPLPPGAPPLAPGTRIQRPTETTFQGRPAFEFEDSHTHSPMYILYDLDQCSANRSYRFHARWLSEHAKPEEVTRIFDSFRLLTKDSN